MGVFKDLFSNAPAADAAAKSTALRNQGFEATSQELKGGYNVGQAGLQTGLADQLAKYRTGAVTGNADAAASAELARGAAAKNVFDAVKGGVELAGKIATGGMFPSFGGGGGGGNPNIPSGGYSASGMPWGSFNV